MTAAQSDLFDGAALRDRSMQQAVDHADRQHAGWSDAAFAALQAWLQRRSEPFMAEEVRPFAYDRGLPRPPDSRAWGAVLTRAVKAGLLERAGFGPSSNPKAHKRPTQLWKAVRR